MSVAVDVSGLRALVVERYAQVVDDGTQAMLVDIEAGAPRDTGAMTQSIEIDATDAPDRLERRLRAPQEYSSYQDEGTGIYGPSGQPITPKTAKVLHFTAKDGTEVFVRSVQGTPPTRWFSGPTERWGEYLRAAMP